MALRSVDFSKALEGVTLSQNFLLLVLFIGFFGWLYVVYWIRHHESTDVNKFYNTGPVLSERIARDRMIVNRVKNSVPVHTNEDTGTVWTPGTDIAVPPATAPQSQAMSQGYSASQNQYPVLNEAGAAVARPQYVDPRFGNPYDASANSTFGTTSVAPPIYGDAGGAGATVSLPATPMPYNPVRIGQSTDGSRLKMFVNR
jgi:hypothetical protein